MSGIYPFAPAGGMGIVDTAGTFDATTVEAALAELHNEDSIPLVWHFPGVLATTTGTAALILPYACTYAKATLVCTTAPTGANGITVDFNYHATSPASVTTIYTTGPGTNRPVITATNFTDTDAAAPDVASYAAGGVLTCDIDTVGGTIAGSSLTAILWVRVA